MPELSARVASLVTMGRQPTRHCRTRASSNPVRGASKMACISHARPSPTRLPCRVHLLPNAYHSDCQSLLYLFVPSSAFPPAPPFSLADSVCPALQSAGMQAIDEIVPALLHALEDPHLSATALDGLKQILRCAIRGQTKAGGEGGGGGAETDWCCMLVCRFS